MFKLSGMYQNIRTDCCVLLYCFVEPFFPPDFGMYKCKESSVHGTISSVVCQNIISSVILLYYGPVFFPPTYVYKYKEFNVHGSISSVVFQNIIITAVLETRSPPPRLLPLQV